MPDGIAQAQTAAEAIAVLSKAFPTPTNAQALAACVAPFEISGGVAFPADAKTKWAQPWMLPVGVIPRMRLAACGWTKPGDVLKAADDAAWWGAPFEMRAPFSLPKVSVWVTLATYVATVEANAHDTTWVLTQSLFDGDSSSISTELANIADDLAAMMVKPKGSTAAFGDCAPFVAIPRPGAQPVLNVPCLTSLRDRTNPVKPIIDANKAALEIAKWLLVIYLLSKLPAD